MFSMVCGLHKTKELLTLVNDKASTLMIIMPGSTTTPEFGCDGPGYR